MKKVKFIITLLICCIIAINFCSCSILLGDNSFLSNILGFGNSSFLDDDYTYTQVEKLELSHSDYKSVYTPYAFNSLETEAQKTLYNELKEAMFSISTHTNDDGLYAVELVSIDNIDLETHEIHVVVEALSLDNPEIFWIDNTYEYYDDDNRTEVRFFSPLNVATIKHYNSKIKRESEEIFSNIPADLSQFQRQEIVHDEFLKICEYEYNYDTNSDNWEIYSIYGALVDGKAVCEGYAKAMQLLLNTVGIENTPINGKSQGVWHQWNVVNIDDKWYHLDSTWNDSERFNNDILYRYFNVTDEIIEKDHIICENYTDLTPDQILGNNGEEQTLFNIGSPSCTSLDANYFVQNGAMVNDLSKDTMDAITQKLYESAKAENDMFYLTINENLDFKQVLNTFFEDYPYYFYFITEDVNEMLSSNVIRNDYFSTYDYQTIDVIAVELRYN